MKKLLLPIALCFLMMSQNAFAQTRPVKGQVLDEKGQPVPGASVQIKGTTAGTITDANGNFSLEVPDEDNTLVISSLGYKPQEVDAGDGLNPVTVRFSASSATTLNETVVIGYTAVKRKDLTGSVSSVNASQIKDIPNVTVEKALQGRAAGVQVVQNSGTPGAGIDVRVRGTTSINAGTQPLYIVDGVPVATGNFSQMDLGGQNVNALAQLNPDDIESIEVLKDAATAAMYGSRASNGVVLITTKKGQYNQDGTATIQVNTSYGVQNAWKKLKTLNDNQYYNLIGDEIRNYVGDPTITNKDALGMLGMEQRPQYYTNYIDYIFRQGTTQDHNVNLSGGNAKTKYYASLGYFKNDGILKASDYDRYSGRVNIETKATNWLKTGANLGFTRSEEHRVKNDNNIYGYMLPSLLLPPDQPLYNKDKTYWVNDFGWENPAANANSYMNRVTTNRFIGNAFAEVSIVKGLSLIGKVGTDQLSAYENEYIPANTIQGSSTNGSGTAATTAASKWINEDYLSFDRTFGKHSIVAAGGLSFEETSTRFTAAQASNFGSDQLPNLTSASTPVTASSSATIYGLRSYYVNANYSYADKYLLSGSFRYDGSSRFAVNNKWASFPGVSAAWRISNEDFFKNVQKVVNDLKIRVGYGVTGNQGFGDFASLLLYSTRPYADAIGTYYAQINNDDLKWEKTNQFDVGLDASFWNSRLTLTADFYNRATNNMILNHPYAEQTGFDGRLENIGDVRNTGWEVAISSQNIRGKDFSWTTTLNLSQNKSTVEKLYGGKDVLLGFSGSTILREGESVGSFYGWEVAGIFKNQAEVDALNAKSPTGYYQNSETAAGDYKFVDENHDGVINDKDRVILGNALPKLFGGFGNTFSYKGLSLDIFCQFSIGNKIFNANRQYTESMSSVFNQTDAVLDRWTPTNTNTDIPRAVYNDPNNNERNSSAFVEDGSYFRIKNVTLSYTLPAKALHFTNGVVKGLRIYATSNNLVTFTKYSGFDPEVNMFDGSSAVLGTDFGTYPQARSFVFGANFTF